MGTGKRQTLAVPADDYDTMTLFSAHALVHARALTRARTIGRPQAKYCREVENAAANAFRVNGDQRNAIAMRSFFLFLAGLDISSAFNINPRARGPSQTVHVAPHAQIKCWRRPRCSGEQQNKLRVFSEYNGVISQLALRSSTDGGDGAISSSPTTQPLMTVSMRQHHMAIKTSNIDMSIAFYSLLDFHPVAKFRSGPARAAWLEHNPDASGSGNENGSDTKICSTAARIELIEVPEEILYDGMDEEARKQMQRKRALDRIKNSSVLGWDHMCLDVTDTIRAMSANDNDSTSCIDLQGWIDALNSRSQSKFGKDLRVALQPRVKVIGQARYQLAFIYDADGGLIELVNKLSSESPMESSWDDLDDSRIIWRNA